MTEFLLVFLLAHLIGDFVLQTDKIAQLKSKGLKGLSFHCAVIFVIQIVFMSLFGFKGVLAAIIVGIIHFLIDYLKLKLKHFVNKIQAIYFLLDQAVHFLIIYLVSLFLSNLMLINIDISIYIKYSTAIINVTYVSSVFVKILLPDVFKSLRGRPFFLPRERLFDMSWTLIAFISLHFSFVISLPVVLILSLGYLAFQKNLWNYRLSESILKLSTLLAFSIISVQFINF